MPNDDSSSIIDKKFFTVRNVGVIALCVFSCASAWGALSHRIDKEKAVNELQDLKHVEHDINLKKTNEKVDKGVYSNQQLAYRLTSANKKYIDELRELIHKQEINSTKEQAKMDYVIIMLEEQKGKPQ
jgi:hypothetical protein